MLGTLSTAIAKCSLFLVWRPGVGPTRVLGLQRVRNLPQRRRERNRQRAPEITFQAFPYRALGQIVYVERCGLIGQDPGLVLGIGLNDVDKNLDLPLSPVILGLLPDFQLIGQPGDVSSRGEIDWHSGHERRHLGVYTVKYLGELPQKRLPFALFSGGRFPGKFQYDAQLVDQFGMVPRTSLEVALDEVIENIACHPLDIRGSLT